MNLNKAKSEKYGIEKKKYIEKNSLKSEKFRINLDFVRLSKVNKNADRKTRNGRKTDSRRKTKLANNLESGEEMLISAEKLKKKDAQENFMKFQHKINHSLIKTKYF